MNPRLAHLQGEGVRLWCQMRIGRKSIIRSIPSMTRPVWLLRDSRMEICDCAHRPASF